MGSNPRKCKTPLPLKETDPSVEQIVLSAKEFLNAYSILSENNERVNQEIARDNPFNVSHKSMQRLKGGELKRTYAAHIVCLAFSLELYLKALYQKLSGQKSGNEHRVRCLFDQIPCDSTKKSIISRLNLDDDNFNSNVDAINYNFEKWRYVHEAKSVSSRPEFSLNFIGAVAAILEENQDKKVVMC